MDGQEITIRFKPIYELTYVELPQQAQKTAGAANLISEAHSKVTEALWAAGSADLATAMDVLCSEMYDQLRFTVKGLDYSAEGLESVVRNFVRANDEAAGWFRRQDRFTNSLDLPRVPPPLKEG